MTAGNYSGCEMRKMQIRAENCRQEQIATNQAEARAHFPATDTYYTQNTMVS